MDYSCGGFVTENLSQQGLNRIPARIFKNKEIEVLDLRFNNIKIISPSIGNLENLKILNLSWNNIKSLPSTLSECTNLFEISLAGNKFREWPSVLNYLDLEEINLSDNLITNIPYEISECKKLQTLNLWKNQIKNIPIEFYTLGGLSHLDLSNNKLTWLPPDIKNLKGLKYLNISNNILDDIPYEISGLDLQVFNYQHNPFRKILELRNLFKDEVIRFLKERGANNTFFNSDNSLDYKTIKIPNELIRPISKYLSFFKEYVLITKGTSIKFDIEETDESLILITNKNDKISSEELEDYLYEYVSITQQNMDKLTINVKTDIDKFKADILMLELKSEVRHLKSLYEIAQFKNKSLENENLYFKQLALNLSSKDTQVIINAQIPILQQSIPKPKDIDSSEILNSIYDKALRMMERKSTKKIEDLHNDELTDFLRDKGYVATDQTRSGKSKLSSGEIDIMIRQENGTPFSIIEAFRLSSCGPENRIVSQHIYKLLNDYDTAGHKTNFVIVYSESANFSNNWENYFEYLEDLNNKEDFLDSRYPIISFINTNISKHTDVKIGLARHSREKEVILIYHIFINMNTIKTINSTLNSIG